MGIDKLGGIIVLFIGIVIAIAFLQQIGDTVTQVTTPNTNTNESLDISSARIAANHIDEDITFTLGAGNWSSIIEIRMDNGTVLAANTDYVVDYANEWINFTNSTTMIQTNVTNGTNVDYSYKPFGYIEGVGARTVTSLITLFAVLGLFGFIVYIVWTKYLKDII